MSIAISKLEEGVTGWRRPHRNSIAMGKQLTLEGDVCMKTLEGWSRPL